MRPDRAVMVLLGATSAMAFLVWGGTTRPMEDTVDYRLAASMLRSGWDTMVDRAPGYPLVLIATGADRADGAVLFLVQLLAHAAAVLLVVDLARRIEIGPRGRFVLAALLVMPPVLQGAAFAGTEVWAELGVVATVWLLARWSDDPSWAWLASAGAAVGLLTLVRPTYQLLIMPLAVIVGLLAHRRTSGHPARAILTLAAPVVVVVGALVVTNAVRFDTPAVDRLLPYHLSEKTALVVDELPASDEPARSILVAERDRLLVEDGEHSPAAFLFNSRSRLERATGLTGAALDRWVLRRDLRLIRDHPLSYLASVESAGVAYVQVDSRDAADGGRVWLAGVWHLLHLSLGALFLGVAVLVPGVALTRGMDRRLAFTRVLCWLIVGYTALVTVLLVNGEPRTRAPTDPLLALLLVSGLAFLRRQDLRMPCPYPDPEADPDADPEKREAVAT